MSLKNILLVTIILVFAMSFYQWWEHYTHPRVFSGQNVQVIDGNTIILEGNKIILKGIAAPKAKQTCVVMVDNKEDSFPCGGNASTRLSKIIGHNTIVECTDEAKDSEGIQLSYCFVNDLNLNVEMVKEGFAISHKHEDLFFTLHEFFARLGQKGLLHSKFVNPWDWKE